MCVAFCLVEHPEHRRFAPVGIRLQQASLGDLRGRLGANRSDHFQSSQHFDKRIDTEQLHATADETHHRPCRNYVESPSPFEMFRRRTDAKDAVRAI